MLHPSNLSGETLGNYRLYESIGAGGMAVVYRAEQLVVHRIVAMKVLASSLAGDDEFVDRFRREAETAARLEHPHIVPVYDFGTDRSILFVVMRYLPGGSLGQRLKRLGIPAMADTADLVMQIGAALDYAHKNGVIHRDIKPANILLDEEGRAYLADFGIARLMNSSAHTVTTGIGTPAYMAPEQFVGQAIDIRTDVYSLGILLYVLTAGKLPFEADSQMGVAYQHINTPPVPPVELNPQVTRPVSDVVLKALAKAPIDRYPSAGALATAFVEAAVSGQDQPTVKSTYFVRPLPPAVTPDAKEVRESAPGPANTPNTPSSRPRTAAPPPLSPASSKLPPSQTPSWRLPEVNGPLLDTQPSGPGQRRVRANRANLSFLSMPLLAGVLVALCLIGTIVVGAFAYSRLPQPTPRPGKTQVVVGESSQTAPPDTTAPGGEASPSAAPGTRRPAITATTAVTLAPRAITATTAAKLTSTWTTVTGTASATSMPKALFGTAIPGQSRTDGRSVAQVWVPAGCFMMGSDGSQDTNAQSDEMPQHQVCITQGFWLDQYEVTNADFQQFIDGGGYIRQELWSAEGWQWLQNQKISGPLTFYGTTGLKQPRVGVSWYEADAYARWRGGRLPTEAEWEYAARGPESRIYPWGNNYVAGFANVDEQATGGQHNNQSLAVGSFEAGKSWTNAYDLSGNVWEWVADWYDASYYSQRIRNDPPGPVSGTTRVLRGGSWFNDPLCARGACRHAKFRGRTPDSRDDAVGFRIMVAPDVLAPTLTSEPSTPTLAAVYGQCPGYMVSRLSVGRRGRVVSGGAPNRVREEPGGRIMGTIPPEGVFRVLDGPRCAPDGMAWWKVDYNGLVGWTAEGQNGEYYLEIYIQPSPTPG